jgi:phosphoribosylanthranilate isomerase
MFQIKICGITHRPDAFVAAALGADAVGLNFYEKSPRFLPPSLAGNVAAAVPRGVAKVGVFVNSAPDEVCRLADRLSLDFIQLSGDEPPAYLSALAGKSVIKAFRFSADGATPIGHFLSQSRKLNQMPSAILIDAYQPDAFGGTGSTIDWPRLQDELKQIDLHDVHVILAGGLTPDNASEAIDAVKPNAVDVASGVEYAPGRKDADLVNRFISTAAAAFARQIPGN